MIAIKPGISPNVCKALGSERTPKPTALVIRIRIVSNRVKVRVEFPAVSLTEFRISPALGWAISFSQIVCVSVLQVFTARISELDARDSKFIIWEESILLDLRYCSVRRACEKDKSMEKMFMWKALENETNGIQIRLGRAL